MIGNSYTQGNATAPATYLDLQGFFEADPLIDALVVNRSDSGATLRGHAEPGGATVSLLADQAGMYDFVVLQERSDRPGRAIKFGGAQLDALDEGGPVLIADHIRVHQPQARVLLFSTWARHPDLEPAEDDLLATYFNDNPVEMQILTNQGYERIRSGSPEGDLSGFTDVGPVGDAWRAWYTEQGYTDPTYSLHGSDGSHQNALGSYLTAAVLYESIARKPVTANSYLGALAALPNGPIIAASLRAQASATVGLAGLPGDYNADGVVGVADYTVWRDTLGQSGAGLAADGSRDGAVNAPDHVVWSNNYGRSIATTAGSRTIPEPGTLLLVFLCLFACIFRSPRWSHPSYRPILTGPTDLLQFSQLARDRGCLNLSDFGLRPSRRGGSSPAQLGRSRPRSI